MRVKVLKPRVRGMRFSGIVPLAVVVLMGCDGTSTSDGPTTEFTGGVRAILTDGRRIVLEETEEIVNVSVRAAAGRPGEILIADGSEGQIRSYDLEGRLRWASGQKGEGPQEYGDLSVARRLPDGKIIAVERSGRIVLRDSTGHEVLGDYTTGLRHIQDIHVLDDSTLIIAGVPGNEIDSPRVHLWSLPRQEIQGSFFRPLEGTPNRAMAVTAGWTMLDVRDDQVATVFALKDTVFIYSLLGELVERAPLPSSGYRRVTAEYPESFTDPAERARLLQSFDLMADIHWVTPDTLVVAYQSVVADQNLSRQWHLLGLSLSTGDKIFEVRDVPRLIAMLRNSRQMIFEDPSSLLPNHWLIGSLR